MQIHDVLDDDPQMVGPDVTLQNAAEKLRLKDQGLLPVCDGTGVIGVLTASNFVSACADGLDPIRSKVREAMTQDVLYCYDDQDLREAAELMKNGHVRRLLVLDRSGRPQGLCRWRTLPSLLKMCSSPNEL